MSASRTDRLFRLFSFAALMVLFYFAGSIAVYYKVFPFRWIDNAVDAYEAIKLRQARLEEANNALPVVRSDAKPVQRQAGAYEGYTLFSSQRGAGAELIDMDGRTVHSWSRPFSTIASKDELKTKTVPEKMLYWRDIYVFPNGDLLTAHETWGDTPYGYGLTKLDKDSNILWHYEGSVHHRINVTDDGKIYTLMHTIDDPPEIKGVEFANGRIFRDHLVVLSPEGKELKRISLLKAFEDTPFIDILARKAAKKHRLGDLLHTNSAVLLEPDLAAQFPDLTAGHVLISMRNINAIAMLDVEKERFVMVKRGVWKGQHHAEFTPDGKIMLFDNHGEGRYSRIITFDPSTGRVATVFKGTPAFPFFTRLRGMQQQLPNGNLLITESDRGRAFEITPKKEIVWRFTNPFRQGGKSTILVVTKRYAAEELPFLKEKPSQTPQ